jgi:Tol biopolymer transport system component/DNA-binding winged helix-turn-helix (wHTH) protein
MRDAGYAGAASGRVIPSETSFRSVDLATPTIRRFGPFSIDIQERLLERDGHPVPLTPKAFDLLVALIEQPGRLVSKDELLRRVWPGTFVEESNLAYNVFAVRKALGDTAEAATYIETVPKRGYRFKAPVAVVDGASTVPARADPPVSRSVWRKHAWTAATVAALALTVWISSAWWRAPRTAPTPNAVPLTSLPGVLSSPSLSPDGRYVVFSWMRPGHDNFDLYVQQVGAGTPLRLTTDAKRDSAPSWSPDGQAIAFLRQGPAEPRSELWLVPPLGGVERKIADLAPRLSFVAGLMTLAWCPDASCLIATDSPGPAQGDALFAIAVASGAKRQLTQAGDGHADLAPAVSRDGQAVVFRRHSTPFTGPLYRLALGSRAIPRGEAQRLTAALVMPTATWMHDNRHVVYSAGRGLWQLDALAGGPPTRLAYVGQDGQSPVIAATADGRQRLVYIRSVSDTNVWRVSTPVPGTPAPAAPVKAVASTRAEFTPALSPDGLRLSFVSDRSGEAHIWVADTTGAGEVKLTSLAFLGWPGFPRWSPDGRLIAFHADVHGRPDVVVVPAVGGPPRILTEQLSNGGFPSFSRDGKWIYFCFVEGTEARVWKMPPSGGPAVRVTNAASSVPIESPAGDSLYYVSRPDRPSALWRVPLDGGAAVQVLDGVLNGNFDVVDRGIYYLERVQGPPVPATASASPPPGEVRLQFHDFSTGRGTTVARDLGLVGPGLSASRDGREVFFVRVDSAIDELMLVDDFR